VPERRLALIIATGAYDDADLRQLRSPAADADELTGVLGAPHIGGFLVTVQRDRTSYELQTAIERFFTAGQPDDLLLLHLSCHGLKSDAGELFFAARNTDPGLLRSTAVPAAFVNDCMMRSRSRSIVLFLDCCYGGAFPHGAEIRADGDVHVLDSFAPAASVATTTRERGRGRAVITASTSMEYSFEGARLTGPANTRPPSVFTNAVVQGLRTGEADLNRDGMISLDELYDYVHDRVIDLNPAQTPSRRFDGQGDLFIARSPRLAYAGPLPAALHHTITDTNPWTRQGGVGWLRNLLSDPDVPTALEALRFLRELSEDDAEHVAGSARAALDEATRTLEDLTVDFGTIEDRDLPLQRRISLRGTALGCAVRLGFTPDWLSVRRDGDDLVVSVGEERGHLRGVEGLDPAGIPFRAGVPLENPLGRAVLTVTVAVRPHLVAPKPSAGAPVPPIPRDQPRPDPQDPPDRPAVSSSGGHRPRRWSRNVTALSASVGAVLVIGMVALVLMLKGGGSIVPGPPTAVVFSSDLPLQGVSADVSAATNNALELYLKAIGNKAGPYPVRLQKYDDSTAATGDWNQSRCEANADAHVASTEVAVVGTYNSGCAKIEVPVLNQARGGPLLMVSQSNTDPGLTKPWGPGEPGKYYPRGQRNYARVITSDDVQPEALVKLATTLHVTKVFVLNDGQPNNRNFAGQFLRTATDTGLTVVGGQSWDSTATSFVSLFDRVKAFGADAVVLFGTADHKGLQLIKDKVAVLGDNSKVKLLASNGFAGSAGYPQVNTLPQAQGMYLTFAGLPTTQVIAHGGAGARLLEDYRRTYGAYPDSMYVLYAVAAEQVILAAVAQSDGTRRDVNAHVFSGPGITIPAVTSVLDVDTHIDPLTGDVSARDITAEVLKDNNETFLQVISV
jgi:branched-chain amino acid transport system substrate-binding protein